MLPRWASVHATGSGCLYSRFSGSGRFTASRAIRARDAMSPRGAILFPVNRLIVKAGTVLVRLSRARGLSPFRGCGSLDCGAGDSGSARNVVPDHGCHAFAEIAE